MVENSKTIDYKFIDELVRVSSSVEIIDPIEGLLNFNMSILKDNEDYIVAFRSSDFRPPIHWEGKISMINMAKLEGNRLTDIDRIYLNGYGVRLFGKYNAMEDPKLFKWKGCTWCLFTRPSFFMENITMMMINLDTKEWVRFDDPLGRQYTKNWMPYVNEERLFFVTDVTPLRVYEFHENFLRQIVAYDSGPYDVELYGSSNIIDLDDRLVALVHGKFELNNNWFYWHRVASWNPDWSEMKIGPPFAFEKKGIEFTVSLMKDNDMIVIPYSVMDQFMRIITIDSKEFGKLL